MTPNTSSTATHGQQRYVILKASGSRYAYINDTHEGKTVRRFDILKGDGWGDAERLARRLNNEHGAGAGATKES